MSDLDGDSNGAREYHYALEATNRVTVREQGARINQTLKRIKKLASDPALVAYREPREDEVTQQCVTMPVAHSDKTLKIALENVEAEGARSTRAPKKKRWFGWAD